MDWKELAELSEQLRKIEVNCFYDRRLKNALSGYALAKVVKFTKTLVAIKLVWGIDDTEYSEKHTVYYVYDRETKELSEV